MSRQKIFATENVNTGRQAAPDFYKALLALFLAYVHVAIETAPADGLDSGWNYFLDTIMGGPFGAPFFMFAMGMGMAYRRNHGAKASAIRGIRLFLGGFVLNILRSLLPALLGVAVTGDTAHYFSTLKFGVFGNDIMQFAGLAYLLMALFEYLNLKPFVMLGISVVMSIIGTGLYGFEAKNINVGIALGHLIPSTDPEELIMADFPVMNWMIIVMTGYIFALYLKRVQDLDRFYGIILMISASIGNPYLVTGVIQRRGMFGVAANGFYHLRIIDAIGCIFLFLSVLSLLHFLWKGMPRLVKKVLLDLSKNLNHIYMIHWFFIGIFIRFWLYAITGTQETTGFISFLLGTFITILSAFFAHYWGVFFDKKKVTNE